jgi:HAD superfamily hydrolase (TIGR01484 family)
MQPLATWRPSKRIIGVLTDIDDTLTTDGAITPDALQGLTRLQAAGFKVIPITGRPVGWSAPFAQSWPVDAIVAENGAVGLIHSPGQALRKIYQQSAAERVHNLARMQAVSQRVLKEVPASRLAQDSAGRETDIAFDHSEFSHLPQTAMVEVLHILRSEGMTATVSSIHINAWFGAHNKLEGARWIVRALWGRDLDAEIDQWVYVGDSTNDQVMFAHCANSVGVANIRRFEAQLTQPPQFITRGERGAGFAELTQHLLGFS